MHQRLIILAAAATTATMIACSSGSTEFTNPTTPAKNNIVNFRAVMNGASEVPAVASPATGLFTASLDTVTNVFIYDVIFSGLTAGVSNGHIHGPASATANSGTTINFNTLPGATFSFGLQNGSAHGQVTLNASTQITAAINGDSLRKILLAGLTYANIHTTAFGSGEIRGQILRQ